MDTETLNKSIEENEAKLKSNEKRTKELEIEISK